MQRNAEDAENFVEKGDLGVIPRYHVVRMICFPADAWEKQIPRRLRLLGMTVASLFVVLCAV
jgi:hypothetical protein